MTIALILCGGSGRRIGGRNKPLIDLSGTTLVERVIERLAPQVEQIVISANQDLARYEALGLPVVRDENGPLAGPLAGVHAAVRYLIALGMDDDTRIQLCPGDTPFLPADLVARLGSQGATVPFDGERAHNLHSQMTVGAARQAMEETPGQSAVHRWLARQNARRIHFSDCAGAFLNINDDEQLAAARLQLEE